MAVALAKSKEISMTKYEGPRLQSFAKAFGEHEDGSLTESEIKDLLNFCGIKDIAPKVGKWERLFLAFQDHQRRNDGSAITKFIEAAMNPDRYPDDQPRYEKMREYLDRVLLLEGKAIGKGGMIMTIKAARSSLAPPVSLPHMVFPTSG